MDAWDTKIIRTKIITLFYYYERVSPRSNNILYIKVFYINITHTHTHTYIYIYIWYAFDAFACVLGAIYFWDFICLKSLYLSGFFTQSSLSGPL